MSTNKTAAKKHAFDKQALIDCGQGRIFGPNNARLPLPNMLMIDRIARIIDCGGAYDKGEVIAELDLHPQLWFFNCHFANDPVMPGCLGLDALWQLLGFFLAWRGNMGKGRALGAGRVKFSGQVLPTHQKLTYIISIKRLVERNLVLGIADGWVKVDNKQIYSANDLRVGLFTSTQGL